MNLPLKISIVTPSYNQGKYIEETILSVLNQRYPNVEYVIIDGGSTDNTIDIIKKYEKKISYWVSEPDQGQAHAINKGFRKISGDILCWLNSDDLLIDGALEMVASFFQTNPQVEVVFGDLEIMNSAGMTLYCKKVTPYNFYAQLFSSSLVPQPSTFWRKSVLTKIGYLNETLQYQMDYEYFLRMGAHKIRFGMIKEPLAKFRLHENSKSLKDYRTDFFKMERVVQSHYLPAYVVQNEALLRILKVLFKGRNFLMRAVVRGDVIPFKNAFYRTKVED